jgi:hypothetical protein
MQRTYECTKKLMLVIIFAFETKNEQLVILPSPSRRKKKKYKCLKDILSIGSRSLEY